MPLPTRTSAGPACRTPEAGTADAAPETQPTPPAYVLTFSCINQPGIVAGVTGTLFRLGCDITDGQQFDDRIGGYFFSRIRFDALGADLGQAGFTTAMSPVLDSFGADFEVRDAHHRGRVLILVSGSDHCLVDLIYRQRTGDLPMEIVGVISNHPRETFGDLNGTPFHFFPVDPSTKAEQEARIWAVIEETQPDLVVLARYMQILSDDLTRKLGGRCINIHHSFLPGFKGAKPYHQAYERGVKVIGATAHYVTGDLDEGPIIVQDVEPVTHRHSPIDLVRKGADIERRVLASAVRAHLEDRVMIHGRTTVVFPE